MQIALGSMQTTEQMLIGLEILSKWLQAERRPFADLAQLSMSGSKKITTLVETPSRRAKQPAFAELHAGRQYSTNTAGNVIGLLEDLDVFDDDSNARSVTCGALTTPANLGNAYGGIEIATDERQHCCNADERWAAGKRPRRRSTLALQQWPVRLSSQRAYCGV